MTDSAIEPPIPEAELAQIAEETSQTERRAAEAERELVEWKKVRFMQDRVGEEFAALVLNPAKYGLFVELTDLFVEGLVPIDSLRDDRYTWRENTHEIIGERTGRRFRAGDRVQVILDRILAPGAQAAIFNCRGRAAADGQTVRQGKTQKSRPGGKRTGAKAARPMGRRERSDSARKANGAKAGTAPLRRPFDATAPSNEHLDSWDSPPLSARLPMKREFQLLPFNAATAHTTHAPSQMPQMIRTMDRMMPARGSMKGKYQIGQDETEQKHHNVEQERLPGVKTHIGAPVVTRKNQEKDRRNKLM